MKAIILIVLTYIDDIYHDRIVKSIRILFKKFGK